jgi:hypothetical protein
VADPSPLAEGPTLSLAFVIGGLLAIARMLLEWGPTMVISGLVGIAEVVLILMSSSILSLL